MPTYLANLATDFRSLAVRVVRALPNIRGRGRIAAVVNRLLLSAGADPVVICEMRDYRLRLDCRIFSHCHAYFSGGDGGSEISALMSFLRPGGTALDVGANIGLYAIPMALEAKRHGARLVAVEPVAPNLAWLAHNLALNGCADDTTILPVGLGDHFGEVEIVLAEDFLTGARIGNAVIADKTMYDERFRRVLIRLDTLDRIWLNVGGRLDVVKVDIEGYESKFLEGGRATIAAHRPVFLMEVNRWFYQKHGLDFDSLIPALLPNDYVFGELRSTGRIERIENPARCRASDIFMAPIERVRGDQRSAINAWASF